MRIPIKVDLILFQRICLNKLQNGFMSFGPCKFSQSITSPSRAWLRLNAFLVLACLLACPPAYLPASLLACLPACLPACFFAFLLASGPLIKLSKTHFQCFLEECAGRTHGRTHILTPWAPVGAKNYFWR